MGKKTTPDADFLTKPSVAAADGILTDAITRGPVSIPAGESEPPGIGDFVLVKDVDPTGNVYPALVQACGPEGAMILEVHAITVEKNKKLPNGQTVVTGVPIPHTFIIMTDEKGVLPPPAKWFPRS